MAQDLARKFQDIKRQRGGGMFYYDKWLNKRWRSSWEREKSGASLKTDDRRVMVPRRRRRRRPTIERELPIDIAFSSSFSFLFSSAKKKEAPIFGSLAKRNDFRVLLKCFSSSPPFFLFPQNEVTTTQIRDVTIDKHWHDWRLVVWGWSAASISQITINDTTQK